MGLLALDFVVGVLVSAVFFWLGMLFVNKVMLNEATAVKIEFWKIILVVAIATAIILIPIPPFNLIISIVVFYFLLMKLTEAAFIEILIIVLITNLGKFIGSLLLGQFV